MLKRATVTYDPTRKAPWFVNLPSYGMQPGSWTPVTPNLIDTNGVLSVDSQGNPVDQAKAAALNPSAVCELPDDTPLDASGQIDKKGLAAMYQGTPFADPDYVPPVLSAP